MINLLNPPPGPALAGKWQAILKKYIFKCLRRKRWCLLAGAIAVRKVGSSGAKLITSLCIGLTTMFALVLVFEVGFNSIPVAVNLSR